MGEFELLERVRKRLPAPGPRVRVGMGDDAAVTVPGGATATSVDALIEGVHFRRGQASLAQIGHKALASALSDLAAMGAEPGEAYLVLGVPPDLDEDGCIELIDAVASLAGETGTTLAGGDVTRAPALTVAITVVGHAQRPELLIGRAGARAGELLVLSGEIGGAASGLLLLDQPELEVAVGTETAARLRRRQLEPQARLAAGRALADAGATAMIDLSDGLGGDAQRLAEESNALLEIEVAALPLSEGVAAVATAAGRDPIELALSGGEDYELLAALPAERLREAVSTLAGLKTRLTGVGEVSAGEGVEIRLPGGRLLKTEGFDQLR